MTYLKKRVGNVDLIIISTLATHIRLYTLILDKVLPTWGKQA